MEFVVGRQKSEVGSWELGVKIKDKKSRMQVMKVIINQVLIFLFTGTPFFSPLEGDAIGRGG